MLLHTYQLKNERSYRFVIKGLHYSTRIDAIKADLLYKGHLVRQIVKDLHFPPKYAVKCPDYENFFKTLGLGFLVGSDFNAKYTWWGSRLINPKGRELLKTISANNLSGGSPTY